MIKKRKGLSGVEGVKGICYQWKEKGQCSKGNQCSLWHESNDHAPNPTPFAATLLSLRRGEEVSEAKVILVHYSTTVQVLFAKDRLVSICILPNFNSSKMKQIAKPMISVRSRIIRLMNKPNKKPKKSDRSNKRREGDDKYPMSFVKIVGCVSEDSELLDSQRGRQARGKPMQRVLGPIRRIRFTQSTQRQASIREKKGPSLGKNASQNSLSAKSYAMKFEDRTHEETQREQRCARGKVWNLANNILATSCSPAETPAASTKEPEEKEFVVDSGVSMQMVSKKDLDSAELETMRISRSPTTVMTANGEVQTREEATIFVKELDLFVTVMLLEETHPQFFHSGSFERIMGKRTTGPAVKNHISPKMARELIEIFVCHS